MAVDQPVRQPLPISTAPAVPLTHAESGREPLDDPSWKSWSFTAITRSLADSVDPVAHGSHSGDDRPVTGGLDEPAADVDDSIPQTGPAAAVATHGEMPLADVVGGTTFGTMVHEILEHVDTTADDLADVVRDRAEAAARRAGLALDVDTLTTGLLAAIDTPLGPLFGGRALRSIAPADRLAELSFDLAIGDGSAVSAAAAAVGDVLSATLDIDDPVRPYADVLRADLGTLALRGWLNGSIDAVFRVGAGAGGDARFVVVDYKTNRLHQPGASHPLADYRPDRLVGAMAHSHYPLQALLYSVAVHRYLRWRLGDAYDPARHLGGVAYLFVRGMVGADTPTVDGVPHGVFSWRPPAATIVELDELFRPEARP